MMLTNADDRPAGFRFRTGGIVLAATVLAGIAAGCGEEVAGPAPSGEPTTTADAPAPSRGWLDDPPTEGPEDDGRLAGEPEMADAPMSEEASVGAAAARDAETSRPAPEETVELGPLSAGNIDDNESFEDFLTYLERLGLADVPHRQLDATGRMVITVTDEDGEALSGVPVAVASGDRTVATLVTTANGRTLFHPAAYGEPRTDYAISAGAAPVTASPGDEVTVVGVNPQTQATALDVAFVIDATGSMGDEIAQLKSSVDSVVQRVESLPSEPDLRLSLTVYRDEGDAYVSATHDFTGDLDEFREALALVEANGGGDYPEALDEALADSLTKPAWRPEGSAAQMIFLVADAPGHTERDVPQPYTESMREAAERGIKIFPIASSASDDAAEVTFRQLAQFTGSRFVFLAYGAEGAATGDSTDIDSLDYEQLSLDDLVVRLIEEELAGRRNPTPGAPPTSTTTTAPSSTTTPAPTTSTPPGQ
ncbi:MAG: VWA domain-containing protein [Microthrixaceae bacterium]